MARVSNLVASDLLYQILGGRTLLLDLSTNERQVRVQVRAVVTAKDVACPRPAWGVSRSGFPNNLEIHSPDSGLIDNQHRKITV